MTNVNLRNFLVEAKKLTKEIQSAQAVKSWETEELERVLHEIEENLELPPEPTAPGVQEKPKPTPPPLPVLRSFLSETKAELIGKRAGLLEGIKQLEMVESYMFGVESKLEEE